ncbi:MAG TPA: selenocysteine-specific translation elongation factor, partial [Steroidobacteraceae bacterium]|nr:selenocysteine-specific translation elongation factor [Steroidobacteraceae bacterium]
DHGKTTLVRALTGVDTDRLKEEKARGISIELGYAYTPLPDGERLGFIDVPGHERFVHTMVAGACGIDFALLVIAADDGVMPQTREHLEILESLGVSRGAVALTKTDRVEADVRSRRVAEVTALLAGTPLRDACIFAVNAAATDDPGTQALRQHLFECAARLPEREDQRLFRLAVDRVFTLSGHGTVATGTVFSGEIHTGDAVLIMPAGVETRVRSIHAQNRPADRGRAGQRCALNLAGVETSALSRGDWLADPQVFVPTTRIGVRLRWLHTPANGQGRRNLSSVHVHLGTADRLARIATLTGDITRAQLIFEKPVCASPGDRFIVRDAQALHTVAGGIVLDTTEPTRNRLSPQRLARHDALEKMIAGEGLAPLLEQSPWGLTTSELVRITGKPAGLLDLPRDAIVVPATGESFVIHPVHWSALAEHTCTALGTFHAQEPDEHGLALGRLRRMVAPDLAEPLWRALIESLLARGAVVRSGPWLHLPDHTACLSSDDQQLANKLQPLIASGGFDPPWVRELAATSHESEDRVRDVLRKSVRQGSLYRVVPDLYYDRECIRELAAIITRLAREHGSVNAARYRDALGLGRKRSIQILEFFDRVGYTRRIRDTHVLRQDSGWPP